MWVKKEGISDTKLKAYIETIMWVNVKKPKLIKNVSAWAKNSRDAVTRYAEVEMRL